MESSASPWVSPSSSSGHSPPAEFWGGPFQSPASSWVHFRFTKPAPAGAPCAPWALRLRCKTQLEATPRGPFFPPSVLRGRVGRGSFRARFCLGQLVGNDKPRERVGVRGDGKHLASSPTPSPLGACSERDGRPD